MRARIENGWLTRLLMCVGLLCCSLPAQGSEPLEKFVAGLQRMELHDVALLYLEGLAARPNLPADVRARLPFEQGNAHLQAARRSYDVGAVERHLLAARDHYAAFRQASPEHPSAVQAGRQLGLVLAELGKRKWAHARAPRNAAQREEATQAARGYFEAALRQADVSVQEVEKRLESLPPYGSP